MRNIASKRKYGREYWREYTVKLYSFNEMLEYSLNSFVKNVFGRDSHVKISKGFDLISFLRSLRVNSELNWPKGDGIIKQYEAYKTGSCRKLDYRVITKSENGNGKEHTVILSYSPYTYKGKTIFFPTKCVHSCERMEFFYISFGYAPLACKHIYSALRKVAEECAKRGIPIDSYILFSPPSYIFELLRIVENEKIPLLERTKEVYFKLIGYIFLTYNSPSTQKFVLSLIRLNRNLEGLEIQV